MPVTGPLGRYGQRWEWDSTCCPWRTPGTVAHAILAGMTELPNIRDLADIPAVEVITRSAVMLMVTAARTLI